MSRWIKLSLDTFQSLSFRRMDRMRNRDALELIWIKLLVLAGRVDDNGRIYLSPDTPYTPDVLSIELQRPESVIIRALEVFEELGMIAVENGIITLLHWSKYQTSDKAELVRKQTRQRVANYRRRQLENEECNADVTLPCSIEEEGEKEKDKEKDTESEREAEGEEEKEAAFFFACQPGRPIDYFDSVFEDTTAEKQPLSGEEVFDTRLKPVTGTLGRGRVMLSESQIDDLLIKLTNDEFDHYVDVVATCLEKGKTYKKSHYQAILDMAKQDRAVIA